MCTRTRAKAPQSHSESCWSHLAEDLLRVVLILAFMAYKLCVCVCLSSMSYFTPRKFLNPTRAIYIYMYLNIQYTYIINKSYNLGAHSLVDFFHVNRWSGWDFWWPQVTAPALVPPKAGIAWPRKRQANCWRPWQTSSRSQQRCTKASIWRKMLPSWMPKMLARKCGYVNLCANVCMWLY